MMKTIKKIFTVLYVIYALLWFSVFSVVVFILVLFAVPFGRHALASSVYFLSYLAMVAWYFLLGLKPGIIYEAPHNPLRPYVFVANHTSYMDIPAVLRYIRQPYRILGKIEMTKIPVFGFLYRSAVILVDRSSAAKRAQSLTEARQIIDQNISVVVFPEGTFNESTDPLKQFYDGAFRMAIATRTPVKPVLFIDSIDRMHWSSVFSLSPGHLRIVYLPEISVDEFTDIKDVATLRQKTYHLMDAALRKYRSYPLKEAAV